MNWYIDALKKYATFGGRARRKEYWYFCLFSIIVSLLLGIIDGIIGSVNSVSEVGVLGFIYSLAVLIPSLAVTFRRLHDTGRSGWWLLILLVPLIGFIAFLVFMLLDSEEEENEYGPSPKYVVA